MMLFFKLINSSFKRNLKVYVPYLISMTMLVAINYIFKAVEINRSLKDGTRSRQVYRLNR